MDKQVHGSLAIAVLLLTLWQFPEPLLRAVVLFLGIPVLVAYWRLWE